MLYTAEISFLPDMLLFKIYFELCVFFVMFMHDRNPNLPSPLKKQGLEQLILSILPCLTTVCARSFLSLAPLAVGISIPVHPRLPSGPEAAQG